MRPCGQTLAELKDEEVMLLKESKGLKNVQASFWLSSVCLSIHCLCDMLILALAIVFFFLIRN